MGAEIIDNHEGIVSVRLGGLLSQSDLAHLQKSMADIIRRTVRTSA